MTPALLVGRSSLARYHPAMVATDAWTKPVTLEGRLVRLEPMSPEHLDGLEQVALDPQIWQWTLARPTNRAELEAWMATAIANAAREIEMPFVTVDVASDRPIGSSRYLNLVPEHLRLEIGWTWVAPAWQRRGANREAKLLMLTHAFETLDCMRVEFKTDSNNEKSRAALLGIGATFEGIFRNHMLMPDGRIRHSAYYSVTDAEWPDVKAGLTASIDKLLAGRTA